MLTQDKFLDFATSRHRISIDKLEVAWDLLMANLAFAVGTEFFLAQLRSCLQTYHRQQFFAKELIRHPEHMHVGHFGMTHQEFLYFAREDILAAPDDHLFETAHDIDVAASIHRC